MSPIFEYNFGIVEKIKSKNKNFFLGVLSYIFKNLVLIFLPVWKNFMALASARPDCLVSSSGADYKAWSGAGQNCNVFVRLAAS